MKAIFLACLLVTPLWPGFFTRPAGRPACRQTCGGPGGQRARGGYGERRYVKIQGGAAPAQIVSQGSGRGKVIALTFDAGADTGFAAQILQTLERDHVTATFGMTGRWARANLPLLRRMARDRDQIINHTYDHRSFTGLSTRTAPLSAAQRAWEINQTDRLVRSVTGHTTRPYFRPPYGDYDAATMTLAGQLGYRYMVMWTLDSLGWAGLSPGAILQRCLTRVGPGTILLMHVGSQSQDATALRALIPRLRSQGYRFVTVSHMVGTR